MTLGGRECSGLGRHLAQWLVSRGEDVVDVPATATASQRRIAPSVGTVGDALDNALIESTIGLYKTELIEHDRRGSWTGRAEVEQETASWAHWFNTTRIHHAIDKRSPIDFEEHYRQTINPPIGDVA